MYIENTDENIEEKMVLCFTLMNPEEIYFLVTKTSRIIVLFLYMQNCSNSKLASSSPQSKSSYNVWW